MTTDITTRLKEVNGVVCGYDGGAMPFEEAFALLPQHRQLLLHPPLILMADCAGVAFCGTSTGYGT